MSELSILYILNLVLFVGIAALLARFRYIYPHHRITKNFGLPVLIEIPLNFMRDKTHAPTSGIPL